MRALRVALLGMLLAGPVAAQELPLPAGAERTAEVIRPAETIRLPTGPGTGDAVPLVTLDGAVTSRAWRLPARGADTLAVVTPLRAAIEAAGWEVLFDCASDACGGFGFRFAVPLLPAPAMFVNLFDYRYLLARRGTGAEAAHLMLFVSRAGDRGYVQVTQVGLEPAAAPVTRAPVAQRTLVAALRQDGHVVLSGVDFASGVAVLGAAAHPDLAALAGFLAERPQARIALVGHTDTVGSLEANIALSRSRAEAVRARLIEDYGADGVRIEAHGIGYLAPRAANDTAEGREINRRVEAVLLDEGA